MKALKEAGYRPADTIRLILGLDEETGRDSVHYYLEKDRDARITVLLRTESFR